MSTPVTKADVIGDLLATGGEVEEILVAEIEAGYVEPAHRGRGTPPRQAAGSVAEAAMSGYLWRGSRDLEDANAAIMTSRATSGRIPRHYHRLGPALGSRREAVRRMPGRLPGLQACAARPDGERPMTRDQLEAAIWQALTRRDRAKAATPSTRHDRALITTILTAADTYAATQSATAISGPRP